MVRKPARFIARVLAALAVVGGGFVMGVSPASAASVPAVNPLATLGLLSPNWPGAVGLIAVSGQTLLVDDPDGAGTGVGVVHVLAEGSGGWDQASVVGQLAESSTAANALGQNSLGPDPAGLAVSGGRFLPET